jgi:hypothetical protein
MLSQLSYSPVKMAGLTGLEPATSGVTGRRCNRLYYSPKKRKQKETENSLENRAAISRFLVVD